MKRIITTKAIEVPVDSLIEVAGILVKNEISHTIVDTDEGNDIITFELAYDREQREAIHEIEDILDDCDEEEEE